MEKLREILGYVLGGLLFVLLIPAVMWFASGRPAIAHVNVLRASVSVLMMLGGLAMSIYTIVYMRQRGKGNPMDAFGHEVAPRTQHLIGRNTLECMQSGIVNGTAAMIDGLIHQLSSSMSQAPKIIATGGMARTIAPNCQTSITIDPHLLFKGLFQAK